MFLEFWVSGASFEIIRLRGLIKLKQMKNNKIEKPKNDVHYVRVSSKEQVTNFSLDSQEKVCGEFSKRSGYEVLKVFREEGESAKTTDRTKLKEMIRFCEINKKQISRIIFYNVSRMSRATVDYLALKVLFKKYDISVVSATEGFDDSASGRLHETILSAFAEFDNNQRSDKTKEGMKTRLLRGLWSTIAPWGYINTRDAMDGKIIAPHPEKALIVKMLFEQYATNKYTFKELAKMASKMGAKSMHGGKMHKQLVAKIITNPIYYGLIVFPKLGISTMGSHEKIIDEKLFWQAQTVRNGGTLGRKLPRNRDNQNYPLRGIKCSSCGKNFTGGKTKGNTKYYDYYGCMNGECEKRTSIPKDKLEKDFTDFLIELTPNNDFFDVLKEAIKLAHKKEINSITTTERKLNAKVAELEDKRDKLLNLRLGEKITDEDFTPANENLKLQIIELKKELSELFSPELEIDNVVDSGIEFLKHLPENWKSLDVKDLRVLRTLLFPSNLTYHYPNIKTPEVCCIYKVEPVFMDEKTRQVTLRGIEPRFYP